MNTLLAIDPQNDFCDEAGALFVPGAAGDMSRLAAFMRAAQPALNEIIVTLDSHPSVAIERTTFWKRGSGEPVPPFTQVTEAQVLAREYEPRDPQLRAAVLEYLHALEAQGRYRLMVWPVHCVVGTWGQNIDPAVANALQEWEKSALRGSFKVLKGMNPMTEAYSAVRAEVPSPQDPHTQTNFELVDRAKPRDGLLIVAGEASSHCIAATLEHLYEAWNAADLRKVVLLSDCMSPVAGFESNALEFFARSQARGVRVMRCSELLTELSPVQI